VEGLQLPTRRGCTETEVDDGRVHSHHTHASVLAIELNGQERRLAVQRLVELEEARLNAPKFSRWLVYLHFHDFG